jgi:hypothetical protein
MLAASRRSGPTTRTYGGERRQRRRAYPPGMCIVINAIIVAVGALDAYAMYMP